MFSKKKLELFDSIHVMPIFNWWNLHKTNDLKWLMVDHKVPLTKRIIKDLYELFDKLNDEFIKEFGFAEEFKEYLEKKREIELLKLEVSFGTDLTAKTFLDIAEKELEKMNKDFEGGNFSNIKASLEKAMGFQINPKETSVYDYHNYIKFVQEKVEKVNG